MTIIDVRRISGLFDSLNDRNKEIAFAYARGLLDYQIIQQKKQKEVTAR